MYKGNSVNKENNILTINNKAIEPQSASTIDSSIFEQQVRLIQSDSDASSINSLVVEELNRKIRSGPNVRIFNATDSNFCVGTDSLVSPRSPEGLIEETMDLSKTENIGSVKEKPRKNLLI